ncbi:copper amine oxidase [Pyrenochaeta sp. MPI-SDFR-AT-0127]|nr:copper amine oxidase [Pyrenochaeta sp. MPI-SDFR-AT-0127]
MRRGLCVAVGFAALFSSVHAQDERRTNEQRVFSSPRVNPWQSLSEEESRGINALLRRRLNLTGNYGSSYQLNLLHPNKTDVLPYLDQDAKEPARYARATVQFGHEDLYWQEYIVGPLPATNITTVEPLTYPFHNAQPGKTKVNSVYSIEDVVQFQYIFSAEVEDITKELWNSTIAEGGVGLRLSTPFWEEDGRTVSWVAFIRIPTSGISSVTLLPLGLYARIDLTSRNWTDWKATGWYSRGNYYESTEELRDAIFSPDFEKPSPNVEGNWTSTDRQGHQLPLDDLPPPISVSQGSRRFEVDAKENYFSWMDFSFYTSVSPSIGLSLHDVRYKGNRLIYELALQEALTAYSGSDPFASQTTLWDTVAGLGSSLVPLIKGYDCPSYATYLNATFSEGNITRTQTDAICVFEYDAGFSIRRHSFQPGAPYTSVAKNIIFTVRTISTVGNYDFLIDYNFFYDGAIEISVRASGYISATYWEGNSEYGFHIHDHLSGSLHDHVLTFKVDLDVLGRKNTVQSVEFVPTSTEYPWSQGRVHYTFKAQRSFMKSESSTDWAANDATIHAIVNKDSPNRFGEFPGYRIKRSAGTSHLTSLNSSNALKAAAFASHDIYFTKHKDTEPRAADPYNQFAPEDPLVDFSRFLDGESIEQEDIVVWVNLGMHHLPHTGDLPNTMFTAAHSAIRFEPLNYLDADPSLASNQQVRVQYGENGTVESVEEFEKLRSISTCA